MSLCSGQSPTNSCRELRRQGVVWQDEPLEGPGFWAVTRHADCVEVNRDFERFSSARQAVYIFDLAAEDRKFYSEPGISVTGKPLQDHSPQTMPHLDLATDEARAFLQALRDGDSPIVIADGRTAFQLRFAIEEDGPTFTVTRPDGLPVWIY